eukprot:TRINITY_DN22894_c0_g1_i1.p1 TRINITY_DN22894_c0_g1~~TRINITY_DN22894_c0_g1_i1.p1  ORF type:complete len:828 (+),score=196.09 TRINITY_DN22894_c0_g1_i1:88-2484(+)
MPPIALSPPVPYHGPSKNARLRPLGTRAQVSNSWYSEGIDATRYPSSSSSPPKLAALAKTCDGFLEKTKTSVMERVSEERVSSPSLPRLARWKSDSKLQVDFRDVDKPRPGRVTRELLLECDAGLVEQFLKAETDHEVRRKLDLFLMDCGVHPDRVNSLTRSVLRLLDSPDLAATRAATALFLRFAARLKTTFRLLEEQELFAASSFLASAAHDACNSTEKEAQKEDDIRELSCELAEGIQAQVKKLRLEQEYSRELAEKTRAEAAATLAELKKPRTAEEEFFMTGAVPSLKGLVETWSSESDRLRSQVSRAQHNIVETIVEDEDQIAYLQWMLKDRVLAHLAKERTDACLRSLRLPAVVVRIALPPKLIKSKGMIVQHAPPAPEVVAQSKEEIAKLAASYDVQPGDVDFFSMDGSLNVFEVHVHSLASATAVLEALEKRCGAGTDKAPSDCRNVLQTFTGIDLAVFSAKKPWHRLQAEMDVRLHSGVSLTLLQKFAAPVEACRLACRAAWESCCESTANATLIQQLLDLPQIVVETELGQLRQEATSLEQLMTDATEAHRQFKEMLAPGTEWAKKPEKFVSKNKTKKPPPPPAPDNPNEWVSDADFRPFSDAHYRDEGVLTLDAVKAKILATQRHFDDEPFKALLDVSSVRISFDSAQQLYDAVVSFRESMRDDIVMFNNEFRNPTCCGFRALSFYVRQRMADPGGRRRVHICEVRFSLKQLEEVRLQAREEMMQEVDGAINAEASGCEDLDSVQKQAIWRIASWVFELTDGRARAHGQLEYALAPPSLDLPHEHIY